MNKLLIFLAASFILFAVSCSDDNSPNNPADNKPIVSKIVKNLNADTASGGKTWTFFSLSENKEISRKDSATKKWDIAFFKTSIICNSGVRGPGNAAIQLISGTNFADLKTALKEGYFQEDKLNPMAINKSNTEKWYNYSGPPKHVISPKPGYVILLKTADGKYAKLRIISYYKDAPVNPDMKSKARFYTFEYVYQPDGSRKF